MERRELERSISAAYERGDEVALSRLRDEYRRSFPAVRLYPGASMTPRSEDGDEWTWINVADGDYDEETP